MNNQVYPGRAYQLGTRWYGYRAHFANYADNTIGPKTTIRAKKDRYRIIPPADL